MGAETAGVPQVRLQTEDAIAWLIIDNPTRRNALTAKMWAAIPDLVRQAEANPAIRVLVVRGAGDDTFSAGADISEFEEQRSGDAAARYNQLNHDAFNTLQNCSKPTIAMIHGFCLGGGLGLAVACDLRYADDKAQFAIPAAKLGIGYNPHWMRPVLHIISSAHAKELLFTAKRFDATWADAAGLINARLPANDLETATKATATEIAMNAPLTIAAAKRTIDALTAKPENADIDELEGLISACFSSRDYAEGCAAFLEKRKPTFTGH